MLPLAADCTNPDWQFMEEYMRRKETLLLKPAVEKFKGGETMRVKVQSV